MLKGNEMFYTVLLRENGFARAGTIFSAAKHIDRQGRVLVQLSLLDLSQNPPKEAEFGRIVTTQNGARVHFSKPTRDLDDAIEEGIMTCEAAYC
jgi:hypothetical protein